MNCKQAKHISLVEYINSLGYKPAYRLSDGYMYHSPLRSDYDPSFHVNDDNNLWFDHGTDEGGTIIDFCIKYHKCDISQSLSILADYVRREKIAIPSTNLLTTHIPSNTTKPKEPKINILSVHPIVSPALIRYVAFRKVPFYLAEQFCNEVTYYIDKKGKGGTIFRKQYYAIGFKNDKGGYELRNKYAKRSSIPKWYTFINSGSKTLLVFEGIFSFLSFLAASVDWTTLDANFLILNSLSFFKKSRPLMDEHELVILYLDNDLQGLKRAIEAQQWSTKYINGSHVYAGFEDWNVFLVSATYRKAKTIRVKAFSLCNQRLMFANWSLFPRPP